MLAVVRLAVGRAIAPVVATLTLSACESRSESSPAIVPSGAPSPSALVQPPADTAPRPFVSPDHSVRRSRPDEVSAGRAPLASECEGDACGAVSVTWLDPGYRFENRSSRDVVIRIWFAAAGDCLLSEFAIAPSASSGWGNVGFCKPYHARFR